MASFGAWTDTNPAPAWDVLTNQAWQEFSWLAEIYVGTETINAVSGQQQYQTVNIYKTVLDVIYSSRPLLRSSEDYERSANPAWFAASTGTPVRWILNQVGTVLSLIPAPNGNGGVIAVRGIMQGLPMANGGDVPGQTNGIGVPIPAYFHEAIALRAAVLWGELFAQGDEFIRLNAYMDLYWMYITDAREGTTTALGRRRGPEPQGETFKTGGQQ